MSIDISNFLTPIYSRTQPNKTDEKEYIPIDPFTLLLNHQDPLHIITLEFERGGINTRDFVKRVHGTTLETTVRRPFWHSEKESTPIKPEHIRMLGKDSPFLTYLESIVLDKFDAYYINLKRRPDKNKDTLVQLQKSNLLKNKMKRFEAIDGKNIDLTNYLQFGHKKEVLEGRRGWIGCALSHIELWKRCVSINKPILVFEDYNVIKTEEVNFDKHLETILNNFPNDFDIVYLVTDNVVNYKPYNDLFVKATDGNNTTSAYFISPSGAKKLLYYLTPYNASGQIDADIVRLTRDNKINCYIYKKSIIYTVQNFNDTDIQTKTNYVKKFEKNY